MPTQIAKSIKQDGSGDYTTIVAFEAAITANLVTADEYWTGTINDSNVYSENVSFSGITADATRSVTLQAGAGQTPTVRGTTISIWMNTQYLKIKGLKIEGNADGATCIVPNQPGCTVEDCTITRTGTTTNVVGIDIRNTPVTIQRNKIHTLHKGLIFGDIGSNSTIKNNLFYNTSHNCFDFSLGGITGVLVYHNSFDANPGVSCIVLRGTGTPTNVLKNNIFRTADGYCIYGGPVANANGITSDNNRFHVTGAGYVAAISTTNYTTLADWQAATIHDDSSAQGAPSWTAPASGDYTLTASDDGESGLSVTDDLVQATRADPGDRGCYEFIAAATGRLQGQPGLWSGGGGGGLVMV